MRMEEYIFSSKIVCGFCGWKMRGKKDRKQKIYICSKYNKNGQCQRNKIKEIDIIHETENIDLSDKQVIVKNGIIELASLDK